MDPIVMLMTFLLVFFGLAIAIRMPIAFSMGVGVATIMLINGMPLIRLPAVGFASIDTFPFLAVPFYIFAGNLMQFGGLSTSLLNFASSFLWHARGSLGAVAIIGSSLFGTLTGSAMATISAIGGITIPEMCKAGYSKGYAAAVAAAGSFLGILIPPSVPGIMYAISSGESIADVWLSTVPPAILITVLYVIVNYFVFGRKLPKTDIPFSFSAYFRGVATSTQKAAVSLMMPIIIFAGIYGGVFTPTEAGAVAVIYGTFVILTVSYLRKKGRLEGSDELGYLAITKNSAIMSASIVMIIVFASLAGRVVTQLGISHALAGFITSHISSPTSFLILANILFLFLGCVMDINVSILIITPIVLPTVISLGIDPLHFGAIALVNLSIGFITPPFAASIFVASRIGNVSFDQVVKHIIPFFLVGLIALAVTTYLPNFSLWLPNLVK